MRWKLACHSWLVTAHLGTEDHTSTRTWSQNASELTSKKQVLTPRNERLLAGWNHTNRMRGLWVSGAATRKPDRRASRGWQRTCWTVCWSVDVSALFFLKMELILVPKYTRGFQTRLLLPPTYLHTSDAGGRDPPAIHLLQGLLASVCVFFFTAELFLILVLAEGNTEQQWPGDIWTPCQAKQCLNVHLGSANLAQVYFNFTKKHLKTLGMQNQCR